jgi:hypothetical protein
LSAFIIKLNALNGEKLIFLVMYLQKYELNMGGKYSVFNSFKRVNLNQNVILPFNLTKQLLLNITIFTTKLDTSIVNYIFE